MDIRSDRGNARKGICAAIVALPSIAILSFPTAGPAEDPPPPTPGAETSTVAPEADAPYLRRQKVYEGLWPFYSHEEFEDGSKTWKSFFSLIRAEEHSNGDRFHHAIPFYSTSLTAQGTDRRLILFPLLYAGRRSPEEEHDYLLPLFYRWREQDRSHTILWPFFHVGTNEARRFPPTLFRHLGLDGEEKDLQRLGLPYILELFEHRGTKQADDFTFLNFFNFLEETTSGLPLAELSLEEDGYYAHLLPFFYRWREQDRRHTILWPLFHVAANEARWFPPTFFRHVEWEDREFSAAVYAGAVGAGGGSPRGWGRRVMAGERPA